MTFKKIIIAILLAGTMFQSTEAFAKETDTATVESGSAQVNEGFTENNNNKGKAKKTIVGYKYVYKTVPKKVKKKQYLGKFVITYYCACEKCCGKSDGITASGTKVKAGRTIAADSSIPFGTKLKIGNKSGYVVEDRGGAITGKHIDIYCSNHNLALKKGKQTKKVWADSEFTIYEKKKVKVPIYK